MLDALSRPIHLPQTRLGIGQSDAAPNRCGRAEAGAGIAHAHPKRPVVGPRFDADRPGRTATREAMDDGVFNKGLKDHRRHFGVQHVFGHALTNAQPIPKRESLDFKVNLEELQLVGEWNLPRPAIIKANAEQAAEPTDRLDNGVILTLSRQHGDGIQRVEQEVRVQLRLERAEAGFGHAVLEVSRSGLETRRFQSTFLCLGPVIKRVGHADNRPVRHQIDREVESNDSKRPCEQRSRGVELQLAQRGVADGVKVRERQRGNNVNAEIATERLVDPESIGQEKRDRDKRRVREPEDRGLVQTKVPRHVARFDVIGHIAMDKIHSRASDDQGYDHECGVAPDGCAEVFSRRS